MYLTTLHAIELAELAYNKPAEDKKTVFIERDSTQVIIRFCRDNAVISFRGTQEIEDWITDVKFIKTEYRDIGKGKLHIGFREAYDSVKFDIAKTLNKRKIRNIYLASHSLGAGLSLICAKDFQHNHRYLIRGVFLFGCPRVFNNTMAEEYDRHLKSVTYRWQNNCDIVCRVPKIGYRHVGKRLYIDRKGNLHNTISWYSRLFDRILGSINGFAKFKIDSFADHKTANYKKRITSLVMKGVII